MAGMNQFELHYAGAGLDEAEDAVSFPWEQQQKPESKAAFTIQGNDGTVWAALKEKTGQLKRVDSPNEADFGFCVLKRRFSTDLAMLTRRHDVLVNSLPAMKLTMLGTKDSLRLAAGQMFYVTERVNPYIGKATAEHVGKKCPFCRMPITEDTHVATCRCGAVYHHETADSHPDLTDEDRLDCVDKVQTCLACGHELKLEEHLLWDPAEL